VLNNTNNNSSYLMDKIFESYSAVQCNLCFYSTHGYSPHLQITFRTVGLLHPHHGLFGSNKQLYKRCAKSMGRPKFRPPQVPNFSTDFNETQNQKKLSGIRPHMQNLVDGGRREGGLRMEGIFRYFLCSILFVFLLTATYWIRGETEKYIGIYVYCSECQCP